jgi:hypothetical protein
VAKRKHQRVRPPPPEIIVAETSWPYFLQRPTDPSERTRREQQAADKQRERQNTARATERRLGKVQKTKVEIIVGEELDQFKLKNSDEFEELRRDGRGAYAIAGRLQKAIEKRLKNELHRRSLDIPRIAQYVKKDRIFKLK